MQKYKCSGDRNGICSIRDKCRKYERRKNPFPLDWRQGIEKDGECTLFEEIK